MTLDELKESIASDIIKAQDTGEWCPCRRSPLDPHDAGGNRCPVRVAANMAAEIIAAKTQQLLKTSKATGMREAAMWMDGGTPRAWGFQHPCDPPGTRWEPTERESNVMWMCDEIREAADRVEAM